MEKYRLDVMPALVIALAITAFVNGAFAASLAFNPALTKIGSGSSTKAVLTLDSASTVSQTIALTNSNPTAASVPSSVTMPAGSTVVGFVVQARTVSADSKVTITASPKSGPVSLTFVVLAPVPAKCDPQTTCNGHGSCDSNGNCVCATGFTGTACSSCATNFFNYPNCKFCDAQTTCNGHGSCDANGNCVCTTTFAGANCNSCAPNRYGYPTCKFCDAATTCSGHGACDPNGNCVCETGYGGANCTKL